jgi:hypothetical protein
VSNDPDVQPPSELEAQIAEFKQRAIDAVTTQVERKLAEQQATQILQQVVGAGFGMMALVVNFPNEARRI